jgi:hypothetical protein
MYVLEPLPLLSLFSVSVRFLSRFPRQLCGAPDSGRAAGVAIAGMEVHAGWCGPSTAVVPTLKKLQWDMVEEKRYRPRGNTPTVSNV